MTIIADRLGHREAVLDRHANIEKRDVGLELGGKRLCLCAVLGFGDDDELGPRLRQPHLELFAQQRLVLGDQCRDASGGRCFQTRRHREWRW